MDYNKDKNRSNFSTPEGYFETLNRKIEAATCNKPSAKKGKALSLSRFSGIMGYAAMFAVVAFVATQIIFGNAWNGNAGKTTAATAITDGLDDSDFIDNMLASYPIDEYTFYCCLTQED